MKSENRDRPHFPRLHAGPWRPGAWLSSGAVLPIYGVLGLIVLWYLAVWIQIVDPVLLPSPEEAARALWKGMGGRLARALAKKGVAPERPGGRATTPARRSAVAGAGAFRQ